MNNLRLNVYVAQCNARCGACVEALGGALGPMLDSHGVLLDLRKPLLLRSWPLLKHSKRS